MLKEGFGIIGILAVGAVLLGITAATAFWAFTHTCVLIGC